jgi:folate-binding protein YgfZ
VGQSLDITLVGPSAWTLLDIESGQPWLEPALSEQFLPQMLNLDHLEGISFDKGCYVGQEIVARTQYLGRLKRRLYKGRVATEATLSPGDALYVPGTEKSSSGAAARGDHAAGTILSASTDIHGRWAVLAVCSIDDASTGDLHIHHVLGPTLELEELPYAVTPTDG